MTADGYRSLVDSVHRNHSGTAIVVRECTGYVAFELTVDRRQRGRGIGSTIMTELTALADQAHDVLATSLSGGDTGRLVDFYHRFAFVRNRGRKADDSIPYGLVRFPRGQSVEITDVAAPPRVTSPAVRAPKHTPIADEFFLRALQECCAVSAERAFGREMCACIPAARLAISVTKYFGHTTEVFAAHIGAYTQEGWANRKDPTSKLGRFSLPVRGIVSDAWFGHVVGIVDDAWMVEFSLESMWELGRERGFELPQSLASPCTCSALRDGMVISHPSSEYVLAYRASPDKDFEKLRQWTGVSSRTIGVAIRWMRTMLHAGELTAPPWKR